MNTMRNFFVAGLLAALLSPISATATVVTYEFEGLVTDLTAGLGLFGSPVSTGDVFTGRFSYETGAGNPDQNTADAERGFYNLTSFELDGTLLSITGVGITTFNSLTPTIFPATPPDDEFRILLSVENNPYSGPVGLSLSAPSTLFSDDSLPSTLDLTDYSSGGFLFGVDAFGIFPAPNIQDQGQLRSLTLVPSSPVPMPPTLLVLGAGLIAVGAVRMRR